MKRKRSEPTASRDEHRLEESTFVDERQVRAFADDLVGGQSTGPFESAASRRGIEPTRASPVRDEAAGAGRGPHEAPAKSDSLWQMMRGAASVPQTLPSLTEQEAGAVEAENCLSEGLVLAFVEGRLSRAELVSAHQHLDTCEVCQVLISEAAHVVSGDPFSTSAEDPVATNLVSGTMLGERYRIQRFIARGGMGEVYEAYDRVLQERIALKTVTATVCDSPKAVRRLMAEVQLARRVSHPNVCRIYDLGTHRDAGLVHFLTMEYVQGESLAKRLVRDGYLPIDEAVHLARQLLKGLEAAHQAGILHRDFKTDNVMLSPTANGYARAVIMDFGLARALDADPGRLTTGANQPLVGTLSYMAPEQVEGAPLSVRTDLYAFGMVLYEMLTGHLPFTADSPAATALRRLRDRPKKPSHYTPELPQELDDLVLRCLSRDPAKRYACADDVLSDLDTIRPIERAPSERRPQPMWRRALLPLVGIAAVVALAIAVGSADRTARSAPSQRGTEQPARAVVAPVRVQAAQSHLEPVASGARAPAAAPEPTAESPAGSDAPAQTAPAQTAPPHAPARVKALGASRVNTRTPAPRPVTRVRVEPASAAAVEPKPPGARPEPSKDPREDSLIVPRIFQDPVERTPAAGASSPSPP